jgi:hypothetical protein
MAVVAKACAGTLTGAISGSFASCALSLMQADTEQDLGVVVSGWSGDPIQVAQLIVVAPSGFLAKRYLLDALVGTSLLVQNKLSEKYTATNDGSGSLQGSVTLVVTSPPRAPTQGATEWTDTSMHGSLDATLPLDPDSPGTPGSQVTAHFDF